MTADAEGPVHVVIEVKVAPEDYDSALKYETAKIEELIRSYPMYTFDLVLVVEEED